MRVKSRESSNLSLGTSVNQGGSNSVVECLLAKEDVASSNLVFRSRIIIIPPERGGLDFVATSPSGKAGVCKTPISGSNPLVASSLAMLHIDHTICCRR